MTFTIIDKIIPSTDGKNTLQGIMYIPNGDIKGIFHLVHGMNEYIGRYEHLFEFLTNEGYACVGFDNLGHGKTAKKGDHGFIASKHGDKYLIDDVKAFADSVKADYPNLPYYLMGHSMGSFITRLAVAKYPHLADKYICCGTGGSNPASGIGLLLCNIIKLFRGERALSPFIEYMVFGSYNKKFEGISKFDWLTKDHNMIKRYEKNEFCKFHFTISALYDLIRLNKDSNSRKWIKSYPKDLPILLVAGDMDPVGNYGKGVREVYDRLKAAQKSDVSIILYENCRHEIHNDTSREQMFSDILKFIKK